jgi:nicotinamidase/pyrazinamidase
MHPDGKLYIPGAEIALPGMVRLVEAARQAGLVHVASVDDHELTDPEISHEPDFRNTFPPHCLRGTPGAEKILATRQHDPLPLSLLPYPPGLVPELVRDRRELVLLKKNFNVFTNPNAEPLLDALDPAEVILFGVATDICNDAAVLGLLQRGRRVRFVEDASWGLDDERVAVCTAAWRDRGVEFTLADEAVRSLG